MLFLTHDMPKQSRFLSAFVTNILLPLLCVHAIQRRSFGDLRNCESSENGEDFHQDDDSCSEGVSLQFLGLITFVDFC